MLNHFCFNFLVSVFIDSIFVYVQLVIDFYHMGGVFHIICELVKQEGWPHEKHWFLKCFIPKNHFQFFIRQGFFQYKPVQYSDALPCFIHCEIICSQGQDIIEQCLISSVPGIHIHKVSGCLDREQPLGNFLILSTFFNIPFTKSFFTINFYDFVWQFAADLNISSQTNRKLHVCPISCDWMIFEQKVFSPTCAIHPAIKLKFFHNVHQDFRLFSIVNINKDGIICQYSTKPIQIFYFVIGFPVGSVFQFFKGLLSLGFNITFVKHPFSPTLCDNFQYFSVKFLVLDILIKNSLPGT